MYDYTSGAILAGSSLVAGRTEICTTDITVNVKFTQCYYVRRVGTGRDERVTIRPRVFSLRTYVRAYVCTCMYVRRWQWIRPSTLIRETNVRRTSSSQLFLPRIFADVQYVQSCCSRLTTLRWQLTADHNEWPYTIVRRFLFPLNSSVWYHRIEIIEK